MPSPDLDLEIPPLVTASVLLAARHFALASGISWPGIEDLLAATGASPELAHELEEELLDQLAAVAVQVEAQPPPPDLPGVSSGAELVALATEMVRFIMRHPGCAQSGARERYTDDFRRFVLELRRRHADVAAAEFAAAIDLPLGTVEDWLRGGRHGIDASARHARRPRGRRPRTSPAAP